MAVPCLLLAACSGSTVLSRTYPYDLPYYGGDFDGYNGLSVNPLWKSQVQGLGEPSLALCGGTQVTPGRPPCTSEAPQYNVPGVSTLTDYICRQGGGSGTGHVNWRPAEYTGQIYWDSTDGKSAEGQDDDYNFNFFHKDPMDTAGYVAGDGDRIHVEFDSDETINNFQELVSDWWTNLHHAVDGQSRATPESLLDGGGNGTEAIVIGAFGLDLVHAQSGGAELHPVYALALHVKADPTDDEWAFLVRNWGNEGYCSNGGSVDLNTQDLYLPLSLPGWTDPTVLQPQTNMSIYSQAVRGNPGSWDCVTCDAPGQPPQKANVAVLHFHLPAKHLAGAPSDQQPMFHGEIHLQWTTAAPTSTATPTPRPVPCDEAAPGEQQDIEGGITHLIKSMTPQQYALYQSALPTRPAGQPDLVEVPQTPGEQAPHLYPRPSDTSSPSTASLPGLHLSADPTKAAFMNATAQALMTAYGGTLPKDLRWPAVEAEPGSVTFSGIPGSPAQKVCISSVGTVSAQLTSITITGSNATDFTITENDCPAILPSRAKCHVLISFSPQGQGDRTATLTITDNADDSPQMVALEGAGQIA
jgi:hypothetical protein